jgi:hypothetical protein
MMPYIDCQDFISILYSPISHNSGKEISDDCSLLRMKRFFGKFLHSHSSLLTAFCFFVDIYFLFFIVLSSFLVPFSYKLQKLCNDMKNIGFQN